MYINYLIISDHKQTIGFCHDGVVTGEELVMLLTAQPSSGTWGLTSNADRLLYT